jgi:hypothetical protein
MFGVISQGVIGLDWPEFVLRGAIVGTSLAVLHRWYVKHAENFWITVFYVFMCVWSYWTYRAGSFYLIVYILHHFVAMLLIIWVGRELLRLAFMYPGRVLLPVAQRAGPSATG